MQKVKLPEKAPSPHVLQFTGEDTVGHNKPKMAGAAFDAAVKRSTDASAVLTSSEVTTLRNATEGDSRVAKLLEADGHLSMLIVRRSRGRYLSVGESRLS